ncbi:outer membrane protein assembly factor BamD [Kiritimatiellaeota bacterium B1221]|nr:outer membrane protein assembly factor BamD [Kiritimatiellaeota bacterium B1221]
MSNKHIAESHEQASKEVQLDWEKHLRWLAPATAVILLAATLFMWTQGKSDSLRVEVMQAYTLASTAEELQVLAEAYPGEPEAPLALLQAGAMFYNEGEFEKAKAQYELFQTNYSQHILSDNAQWGIWMSEEALDNLDSALEGFRSVEPGEILFPQALLGQARILEKQQQNEAALELYATLQADFPQSSWAEQARVFSERLQLAE